jgi:aarF domain-containing kinase
VHADMHPGNILVRVVRPKSAKKSKPHVVFLDVGMTAELSSSDRVNLLEFFKAVALRDGRTAALSTLKLSKNQNCPNPQAFIKVCFLSYVPRLISVTCREDLHVHPGCCRVSVFGN